MYEIRNTERNNQTASEYETKALLHVLVTDKANDDLALFFVDCFNDVTGASNTCDTLWDVQSKGVKSLRPRTIGEALITLLLNYQSELTFCQSLLFIPKLNDGYLINEDVYQFDINNFNNERRNVLKQGLVDEYLRRKQLEKLPLSVEAKIDEFLLEVLFVVALPEGGDYVRDIVEFRDKELKSPDLYREIFKEIRDKQTVLKNINIEGARCEHASEILEYEKHIKKDDISILVVSRLIGIDLFDHRRIPIGYINELRGLDEDEHRDVLQHNNACLAKALFNKNNKQAFWRLLERIIVHVKGNPEASSREVFDRLPRHFITQVDPIDETSTVFFISLIKEGLNNEN